MAVIFQDATEAKRWYEFTRHKLDDQFRNPTLSDRAELTARYRTHVTTARETKGLEFDAVVVPDLSSFHDDDPIARNAIYVAVSRPRHAILLGCRRDGVGGTGLASLIECGHLVIVEEGPDHASADLAA